MFNAIAQQKNGGKFVEFMPFPTDSDNWSTIQSIACRSDLGLCPLWRLIASLSYPYPIRWWTQLYGWTFARQSTTSSIISVQYKWYMSTYPLETKTEIWNGNTIHDATNLYSLCFRIRISGRKGRAHKLRKPTCAVYTMCVHPHRTYMRGGRPVRSCTVIGMRPFSHNEQLQFSLKQT